MQMDLLQNLTDEIPAKSGHLLSWKLLGHWSSGPSFWSSSEAKFKVFGLVVWAHLLRIPLLLKM